MYINDWVNVNISSSLFYKIIFPWTHTEFLQKIMIPTLPQYITQLRWPRGKWLDCGCQGHQFESCWSSKIEILLRQMEYYNEWLSKNALIFRVTQISTMRQREYKDGRIFGEHVASYGELLNCHCSIMALWCWLVEQINIHIDSSGTN